MHNPRRNAEVVQELNVGRDSVIEVECTGVVQQLGAHKTGERRYNGRGKSRHDGGQIGWPYGRCRALLKFLSQRAVPGRDDAIVRRERP